MGRKNESAYQKTEKLLRAYPALKEHVSDEDEYMDMIFKGKSKSVTSWSKTPAEFHEDQALRARYESLLSQSDFVIIRIFLSDGRFIAMYNPEHPVPAINMSVFINLLSAILSPICCSQSPCDYFASSNILVNGFIAFLASSSST